MEEEKKDINREDFEKIQNISFDGNEGMYGKALQGKGTSRGGLRTRSHEVHSPRGGSSSSSSYSDYMLLDTRTIPSTPRQSNRMLLGDRTMSEGRAGEGGENVREKGRGMERKRRWTI